MDGDSQPFDPCECIFSHEGAMRRLISLLRNSQNYCTDTECFQNPPGPERADGGGDFNMLYLMMAWMFIAVILYFLRPSSLRHTEPSKPRRDDQSNPGPPAPPIM